MTPKQEKFAQAVASGKNQSDAYREAYDARKIKANRWQTITHKHNAKTKLVEAANILFAGVAKNFEVIAKQYRALMSTRLEALAAANSGSRATH